MSSDTLNLLCPECDSFIPVTTYNGPCKGIEYSLDEAPLIIVAEVHQESKIGRIQCMSCGMHIALVVKFIAVEQQLSVQKRFNIKWRIV